MNPWVRLSVSVYRRLAQAFPHEFRMLYGVDLERLGEDAVPVVWRQHGFRGLVRLLADIALRLPAEYLAEVRQDLGYALRRLGMSPGFTAVGILSLAMGIGMCIIFFAQSHAMILRPAPGIGDPGALVALQRSASYPYFENYREHREIATAATAFMSQVPFTVAVEGAAAGAERVNGHLVSPEYFSTLEVAPGEGRFFGAETERAGSAPVVVISEQFWRTRLNSDPEAVGRTLRVNGHNTTIIGIGPEGFRGVFPIPPADVFVPVTVGEDIVPELRDDALGNPDLAQFRVVLRLASGVTAPAAEAALDVVTRRLDQQRTRADPERPAREVRVLHAGPLFPMTSEQRMLMLGLNGLLLAMVLSLACANLAILLLARGNERRREIAIRLSVGASRFRLVRQLLTESLILSLAGGVAGLALYYGLTEVSRALSSGVEMGFDLDMRPDLTVVLFTFAAAVTAGLGFGLTPALASARGDVVTALKDGGQPSLRRYRRFGMRNQFVVFQVANSLMLLLISGYVVVGYQRSTGVNPGFDAANLFLFSLDPRRDGYSPEKSAALLDQLPDRLLGLAEVRGLTIADRAPSMEMVVIPNVRVSVPAEGAAAQQAIHSVIRQRVGARYFATLGVALVRGREFDDRDLREVPSAGIGQNAEIPVVVNQTAASELFGDTDPIGKRIREGDQRYFIIGVASDMRTAIIMPRPTPALFLPLTAESFGQGLSQGATVLIRGSAGPNSIAAVLREMELVDPALTIFNIRTMSEYLDRFNEMVQWSSLVNGSLGLFGLILAAIGLAAVTSHAVTRRRKEIGIRMALGARRIQAVRLVLKEGVVMVIVGSVLGFLGAWGIARMASAATDQFARIFAVGTGDPLLVIGAPLLLVSLALLACYLPARRATRIDPLAALREE